MLTEDDLAAVLSTFTSNVKRLILVGDPAQLPPIGPGRPFADLVAFLDPLQDPKDEDPEDVASRIEAIACLTQEVRTVEGTRSDTLRLANWFTNDKPSPDAESIFSALTDGTKLNDLDVRFWDGPDRLHAELLAALRDHLKVDGPEDLKGFNESLLMQPYMKGWTTRSALACGVRCCLACGQDSTLTCRAASDQTSGWSAIRTDEQVASAECDSNAWSIK